MIFFSCAAVLCLAGADEILPDNSVDINGTAAAINSFVSSLTVTVTAPTTIVQNSISYTVTEPTVLTITDCPCTISTTLSLANIVTDTGSPAAITTSADASSSAAAETVNSTNIEPITTAHNTTVPDKNAAATINAAAGMVFIAPLLLL